MIRYRLFSVDPLDEDDQRPLDGTYPLEVAQRIAAAAYSSNRYSRVIVAQPVDVGQRRHCYYVQAGGQHWHIVADSPIQAARQASRRGLPASVWYCRDDFKAGCDPLHEIRRATA